MAFDSTEPVASSLVASAPVRANFAAIPPSLLGCNWLADPNFYIWPEETSNGAASQTADLGHWELSGTGATMQRCGTGLTDTKTKDADDGWTTKLSSAAATAYLLQWILPTNTPVMLQGQSICLGAWVWASSSSVARLATYDNDTGYSYSSYHTGGSSWEWLTLIHELGNGTNKTWCGLEVASGTNAAYIQGATAVLGDIKPVAPIPSFAQHGSYLVAYPGTPTAATYAPFKLLPGAPFLFTGLGISAYTAGTALTVNVRKHNGSTWVDMLSANLSKGSNIHATSTSVDSIYRYRCLRAAWDAATATQADRMLLCYVATNTGAADLSFHIRGIQFVRPQDAMFRWQNPNSFGAS
jgi:hypothetical protein